MADLDGKQASQSVKIAGADPITGVESNYADVDSNGNVKTVNNNGSGASAVNIQDGGNSITVDQSTASNLNAQVVGNVAHDANDSGNPVKIGGVYNTTIADLEATDRGDVQLDRNSNVVTVRKFEHLVETNKVYSVSLNMNAATGSADNGLIYIRNPSGSGKRLVIKRVIAGCDITNQIFTFKVFANPTVSVNGSSETPAARNIGNSQPAASALVTTLPTVTSTGTVLASVIYGSNGNSIDVIAENSVVVQEDNSILIVGRPGSNNRTAEITVVWAEI